MRFRSAIIAAVSLVAIVGAAVTETARASGAYTSLTTSNAAACARACAEDGICMAWSFHAENQCQLSAVVTAEPIEAQASGFSSRAPAALRPITPVSHAQTAPPPSPTAPQAMVQAPVSEDPIIAEPEQDDLVLLGGPSEGDLRLGLR
jgi:hypothetical protein